jgi:hypothetical protein
MSDEFLRQVAPVFETPLLSANHFRLIAEWSLDYFRQYSKAPKQHIENMYHGWVEKHADQRELVSAIHDLLEFMSSEYAREPDLNIPFLIDQMNEFFTLKKLQKVKDELEYSLVHRDVQAAKEALAQDVNAKLGQSQGYDPLHDDVMWERAFSESQKPLLAFEGDAGKFFTNSLSRDALIGILAPEKRGKSWWCVEFVFMALQNRKRVALFEVGDMSESQIQVRLGSRLSGLPSLDWLVGQEVRVPTAFKMMDGGIKTRYSTETLERLVDKASAQAGVRRFLRRAGIPREEAYARFSVHANGSVCVGDIDSILTQWECKDGFIPDVIVVDYADILAPEPGTLSLSRRDQINMNWMALRRLSQERRALVIVPTQADADSYGAECLNLNNFTEDKRKGSHVTGMIGLNQTDIEKQKGIMRLNWLLLRGQPFSSSKFLYVGQCLELGRAMTCCYMSKG